jgi:lysozyme family protein
MMVNNFFDQAFSYLLANEGFTYTNDPLDSGGPTKFGITQKTYESFVGRLVEAAEIKDLTIEEAKKFYFERYWLLMSCDKITVLGIAVCIFDTGVLYGPGTSAILAQKTANLCGANLKFDGHLGEKSIEFINLIRQGVFLENFHALALARIDSVIASNPKNEVFKNGWVNRANRLLTLSNIVPALTA